MTYQVPFGVPGRQARNISVDFDVGDSEVIEQTSFEIEEITLTGEHHVVVGTEVVSDITITGEHSAVGE